MQLVIIGVEVLHLGVQRRAAGRLHHQIHVEALDRGLARVLVRADQRARCVHGEVGDLLIAVLPDEPFEVQLHVVVEEAVLRSDSVGGDELGLVAGLALGHLQTARAVAAFDRGIDQAVGRHVVFGRSLPRHPRIALGVDHRIVGLQDRADAAQQREHLIAGLIGAACRNVSARYQPVDRVGGVQEIGIMGNVARRGAAKAERCGRGHQRRWKPAAERDEVVDQPVDRLLVMRVARAADQAELVSHMRGQLAKPGIAVGLVVIVDDRQHEFLIVLVVRLDLLVEVERAQHVVDHARAARKPRFEAGLPDLFLGIGGVERRAIEQRVIGALAIGRDHRQLADAGLPVQLGIDAPVGAVLPLVGVHRIEEGERGRAKVVAAKSVGRGRIEALAVAQARWKEGVARRAGNEPADVAAAHALAANMSVVRADPQRQVARRFDKELRAQRAALGIVGAVDVVAVARGIGRTQSQRAVCTHAKVDMRVGVDRIIVAVRDIEAHRIAADFRARRNDVDRAAGGIATVENALRSLEHFNARKVIECRAKHAAATAQHDAVIARRHRGIVVAAGGHVAHAANEDRGDVAADRWQRKRRDGLGNVGRVGNTALGQISARNRVDRDGRLLQRFLAALRSHDDFGNAAVVARFGLRFLRRNRCGHCKSQQGARPQKCNAHQFSSPMHGFCPCAPDSQPVPERRTVCINGLLSTVRICALGRHR